MVNQCVNVHCPQRHEPPGHDTHCMLCSHPLVLTPDYSQPVNAQQVYPASFLTGFTYGQASPANSSAFHNSPAASGYNLPASNHAQVGQTSPTVQDPRSPYISPGCVPATAHQKFQPAPFLQSTSDTNQRIHNSTFGASHEYSNRVGPKKDPKFVSYDPDGEKVPKGKRRSCIRCYKHNNKCQLDEGSTYCRFCVDKGVYCSGDIDRFSLSDNGSWFRSTAALCAVHPADGNRNSTLTVEVRTNHVCLQGEKIDSASRSFSECLPIDLDNLHGNVANQYSRNAWANIFDKIFPEPMKPEPEPSDSALDEFQRLCRRFVTCLATIRNMRLSTIDFNASNHPAAPLVVLEILRQLSSESCELYREIFDSLVAYINGPRSKNHFRKQIKTIALQLKLLYKALQAFGSDLTDHVKSCIDLTNLFHVPPSILSQLECLGNTFSSSYFKSDPQSTLKGPPGIHIVLPNFEGNPVYKAGDKCFNEPVTFLEILERTLCSEVDPNFGGNDEVPRGCHWLQQSCSPFAASTREVSYVPSSCRFASQNRIKSPKTPSPDAGRDLEHQGQIEITRIQQELAEKDEQHKQRIKSLTEDLQRQLDTENEQYLVYKKIKEDEINFWKLGVSFLRFPSELKQVSTKENMIDPPSGETTSTGSDDKTISKTRIVCAESNPRIMPTHTTSEYSGVTDRITISPISEAENDHSAAEINSVVSSTSNKRKRLSNIFLSWKKPRLAEIMARSDNVLAENDVLMSGSIHDTQQAPVPFPSVSTKGRLSRIITLGRSSALSKIPQCVNIAPKAPQSNPNSERPSSWPRSHRWRKSFGVSVKQLRENFEKLTIDQVEHFPQRPIE